MKWKDFITDYLHFTRRERVGIFVLIFLIVLVFLAPEMIPAGSSPTPSATDTAWMAMVKLLEQKAAEKEENRYNREPADNDYENTNTYDHKNKKGELFYFDPNTLSPGEWERLGLREKTIRTILNYLGKGGRFREAEDLQRIYGLFPDEYERIAPYIRITAETVTAGKEKGNNNPIAENRAPKNHASKYQVIDINTADTTAFISLPGIGSKLSARIVSFRDKLGGFYSIDQVAETFGLPDSTFQKIKPWLKLENTFIRKININTASIDELKAHPYIKYSLANPIVAYRNEHGPFSKLEDLKKVMAVSDQLYQKLAPYLLTQ